MRFADGCSAHDLFPECQTRISARNLSPEPQPVGALSSRCATSQRDSIAALAQKLVTLRDVVEADKKVRIVGS